MTPTILRLGLMAALAAAGGCTTVHRATLEQLQYRATFDLGCPGGQLWLYHIDSRTKAVAGCGQRFVYLEQCDAVTGACSWKIDTPALLQARGQQPLPRTAAAPGAGTRGWPAHGWPAHGWPAGASPPEQSTPAVPPRGRTISTELFGADRARTAAQPPEPRDPPTELFGEEHGASAAPPAASTAPTAPPSPTVPVRKPAPAPTTPPLPVIPAVPPPPRTPYDHGF